MKYFHSINTLYVNFIFVSKILIKKPLLVFRLVKTFFFGVFFKAKPLRFVDLAISYECNFSCTHCSAKHLMNKTRQVMTSEDYKKVGYKLRKAGAILFHLTGGEPLLNPDLENIIKALNPKTSMISIQSNAFLVNDEKLKNLRKIGVDIFCVSVDSGDESEHDIFRRQPGSFKKTMEGIKLAQKHGFKTTISTCVHHGNLSSSGLIKIIELAKEMDCLCFFNLATPVGNWEENEDIIITPDDRKKINELLEKYPHCRIDFQTSYAIEGCPAVKEKVYVTAYGDIMPCPFIQVAFGNILESDIKSIRERALKIDYFNKYHNYCLAAEDVDFYKLVYSQIGENKQLPIDYRKIWK